ncbi:SDR family NAD(P)-dependent oxidoreductase [Acaryochloris sp. IP29b_bin.148]|uniref:SDR family NAD(P)-dependent oxidoreductase n=1 Tax=Acaryochloris sp. IP29b_bin.148 TaxID=2969218 RepID=UPI00262C159E|nr:SDR family NAD(P)-dependent oxidoreductase [Acaryochloris sp. IP29b_bin.148]
MSESNALVIGASQGIGLGFVQHLLQRPQIQTIYATYRAQASAAELFALAANHPERVCCLSVDVTQEEQIAACCEQIQADRLHWVINSVGILHEGELQPEKGLRQLNAESLTRYFQVNSIGAALWAKHLLPLLKHEERSILATISAKIGSIGDNHLGGWYGYRASKAALNMLMRTAAIEYRRRSPQTIVVTLHPGTTDTKLSKPFQRNVPPEKLFSVDRTVTQLLAVLDGVGKADSGQFFSWDGSLLPW